MSETHDVVVIGAGHNGLVAACYLARAGLDVLVVEAASVAGGMTSTIEGAIPEAPHHKINVCSVEPGLLRGTDLVADLGLARYGYREVEVDPFCVHLMPGGESVAFWRDPRRTADEIRRFSKTDADGYLDFARVLDTVLSFGLPLLKTNPSRPGPRSIAELVGAAVRRRKDLKRAGAFMVAPFGQALAEYFEHPIVRNAFTIMAAGPNASDASAIRLIPVGFYHRFGLGRPIGGTQTLVDALIGVLEAAGGRVRTAAPVAEICVTGGRAGGVRLENGETIQATKAVLATSDPRIALGQLLPKGTLDRTLETRVEYIPAYNDNVSHLKVDLALSGQVRLDRFEQWRGDGIDLRKPTLLLGSWEASTIGYHEAQAGHLPSRVGVWSVIPTAADPTQAPAGQDTVYTYSWPFPLKPVSGWDTIEADAGKIVVTEIAQFYDGLEELELGRRIEGPDKLAKRLRVSSGCVEHVDFSPFRQGPLRPAVGFGGYRTPVPGLYLGGSGSHPGPAVHGIPGRLSAQEILRNK